MRRLVLSVVLFVLFAPALRAAQQTAPAGDVVIGSGNFSPIVSDLAKSLAFYSELVGATTPATPDWSTDTALLNFLGTPTAHLRFATVRIPGSSVGIELVEFKDIDRKPVRPRVQDPGATLLMLLVRDVDAALARAKAAGASVVTVGGAPVALPGQNKARAVIMKDPDGFHVGLMQLDPLPQTTAPAGSNIIGASIGLTVASLDQAMHLYQDVLGFQPQIDGAFHSDKAFQDLLNSPGLEFRRATARVPGSAVQMEFFEFKGAPQKPIGARIQDPGATRFQLRVRDADAAVKTLKTLGGEVITTGGDGGPINMRNLRVALVRELNNLFLVIMTQGAPANPR